MQSSRVPGQLSHSMARSQAAAVVRRHTAAFVSPTSDPLHATSIMLAVPIAAKHAHFKLCFMVSLRDGAATRAVVRSRCDWREQRRPVTEFDRTVSFLWCA
jgi:hypothetical protein